MSRLPKIVALTSLLAIALAGTAIALGQNGGATTARQPAAAPASSTTTTAGAYAARQSHRFRGRVTSADRSQQWFRMRTTTSRSVRIDTNRGTRWNDCDWGDMQSGHYVDVRAHRSHGHWVASRMQNWHDRAHDWATTTGATTAT